MNCEFIVFTNQHNEKIRVNKNCILKYAKGSVGSIVETTSGIADVKETPEQIDELVGGVTRIS